MHESERAVVQATSGPDGDTDDELEGIEEEGLITSQSRANAELSDFERNFCLSKYHPKYKQGSRSLNGTGKWSITFGEVETPGANLPGSSHNLADYMNPTGDFDIVTFYSDHKDRFSKLYLHVLKLAAIKTMEVGCERLFSFSGYASSSRRTNLGVRHFERSTLLAEGKKKVFLDTDGALATYIRKKKLNDLDEKVLRDDMEFLKREYGEESSDEEVCGDEESAETSKELVEIDGSEDDESENEEAAGADEDEVSVTNIAHC